MPPQLLWKVVYPASAARAPQPSKKTRRTRKPAADKKEQPKPFVTRMKREVLPLEEPPVDAKRNLR